MDSDYEGNVVVRGQNLSEMTEKEMDDYRKNNVGFVFQNFNLIPHLSVLENVTIAMQMTDTEVKERTRRAIDILTEVGLKEHLHKRPNQLSGDRSREYRLPALCPIILILFLLMSPQGRWIGKMEIRF